MSDEVFSPIGKVKRKIQKNDLPINEVVSISDDDDKDKDLLVLKVKESPPKKNSSIASKKFYLVDLTRESPQEIFPVADDFVGHLPPPPHAAKVSPHKVDTQKPPIKCNICLDGISHPTSTICGHLFCESCIRLAIRQTNACPTCRRKLTVRQVHRVYL